LSYTPFQWLERQPDRMGWPKSFAAL